MTEHCAHAGLLAAAPPFAFPGATDHYAPDRPVRAQHVRIQVDLDFESKSLEGVCTTTLEAVREVTSFAFDAVELDVRRVLVNGTRAEFDLSGDQLWVRPRRALAKGAKADVAIHYRCTPSKGLYFWGPDEGYPDRPLQAWTQGQDEDSRAWFPCLDAPAQKATTEVIATFPARMTALSNGSLVSNERDGARRTMHYKLDYPHSPYLVTLVVGEFDEAEAKAGKTPLRYLYPKGRKAEALRVLGRTPEMIALFEDLTGRAYPFGSYAQVFVTEFIFGAMENTSATTHTDVVLHDARAALDYTAEWLVAHELAHQWFGDLVTCREWPHGWLNEGFATYFEVLWYEHGLSVDEADQKRKEDLDAYLAEVGHHYARPIVARKFHLPIELFDRHLYQKGGLVLHELRRRLGDELFWVGIRHYLKKHEWQSVQTADLARAIEEATGHNVDRFFDQYVFAAGHPQLKVEVKWEGEEGRLRVKVKQTQKAEKKDDPAPMFDLPLPLEVHVGGDVQRHELKVTGPEHQFFVACAQKPSMVLVDGRRELVCTLEVDKAVEWWVEELRRAPAARARTEAAAALGKDATRKAVDALAAALPKEKFWGTQAAIARALGQARTEGAKRALLDNVRLSNPKGRKGVVAALGNFRRDPEVFRALKGICQDGDKSYFVEGEAGRSLGKMRMPGLIATLKPMLRRRSFQDTVAQGAIDGLAESMEKDAWDVVEPLTRYGQPPFVRRQAVSAVGKLGEPAEKKKQAVELLSDLLRDPQFRVQLAAFDAARWLADHRMIQPIETTPYRDGRSQRSAREAARGLREGSPPQKEVASLREEIDKLKEETRKLRERLEAVEAPGAAKKDKAGKGKRQ
ncbi:MAG TPA: M1 family aminopeptidase [Myxococcaceae bacterium]|nr:M1 family aminopeptidase [Myxococcaceae bacterium]